MRNAIRAGQGDHAERLAAIRARIRRSLGDPRPDLDSDDVDRRLEALFVSTKKSELSVSRRVRQIARVEFAI